MSAKVTRVETDSEGGELAVEVTVIRDSFRGTPGPNPFDIPEDIREALRLWLEGNQA